MQMGIQAQAGRYPVMQAVRLVGRQAGRHEVRQAGRQVGRKTNRPSERQTNTQTADGRAGRQVDGQVVDSLGNHLLKIISKLNILKIVYKFF